MKLYNYICCSIYDLSHFIASLAVIFITFLFNERHVAHSSLFFAHAFWTEHFSEWWRLLPFEVTSIQANIYLRDKKKIVWSLCNMLLLNNRLESKSWHTQGNYGAVVIKNRLPRMFYYSTFLWPSVLLRDVFIWLHSFYDYCLYQSRCRRKERDEICSSSIIIKIIAMGTSIPDTTVERVVIIFSW